MDDIDRLVANLEYMSGDISDAVEHRMRIEVKRIQGDTKRLAPVDTGHLREMITADVERDADGDIVGTVGTNVEYAAIKEFGSGPIGEASPKFLPDGVNPSYRKDAWTYKDPKTGKFKRTRGQPATPFLYPAFKLNEAKVRENIMSAAKKAIRESFRND